MCINVYICVSVYVFFLQQTDNRLIGKAQAPCNLE